MKNNLRIIVLLIVIAFISITSCKKLQEKSAKDRLSRAWKVSVYKKNNVDETTTFKSVYVDYTIVFNDNGNYTISYKLLGLPVGINGNYVLENGDEKIRLTESNGNEKLFTINDLTISNCIVTSYGTDTEQIFLVAQ